MNEYTVATLKDLNLKPTMEARAYTKRYFTLLEKNRQKWLKANEKAEHRYLKEKNPKTTLAARIKKNDEKYDLKAARIRSGETQRREEEFSRYAALAPYLYGGVNRRPKYPAYRMR